MYPTELIKLQLSRAPYGKRVAYEMMRNDESVRPKEIDGVPNGKQSRTVLIQRLANITKQNACL